MRFVLMCLLVAETVAAGALSEPSVCDVVPFQRTIEEVARHEVRSGVCSTFMVVSGTVLGLEPIAVVNTEVSLHTLMSVEVHQSWKARLEGVQRVRLAEDLREPAGHRPDYPPFAAGDECVLYLVRDSLEELVAYPSLAIRDSVILGFWGVPQQVSRDDVFALVDSCAADRSLDSMARRADLIIEGDVESSWEDWGGQNRTACSVTLARLSVHKGSFADNLFNLISVHGRKGWNSWPTFDEGERVLLFLEDDAVATHTLVGGWQGKWQLEDEDVFRVATRSAHGRFGVVSQDAPVRASAAPLRAFSRSQLGEALRAVHTLSN